MERVPLERKVLNENDRIAAAFAGALCRTRYPVPQPDQLARLREDQPCSSARSKASAAGERVAVLTGDIQTENDAKRLARFGFPVKQITTGGTCHLDARMIERALLDWRLEDIDLLLIENVGNLVCPSSYDLGEAAKIVVLSVAEGEDKPLKYPSIFFKSELLVLNKTDLLPYVPFDIAAAEENARRVHRNMDIVRISCETREGMAEWLAWLDRKREITRAAAAAS